MGQSEKWGDFVVRSRPVSSLDANFIRRWKQLANSSIEKNPFISPEFVLATSATISRDDPQELCTVETRGGDLTLVAVLKGVRASKNIPFPHWHDCSTIYHFQGGIHVHPDAPLPSLIAFLNYCKTSPFRHGLKLHSVAVESEFAKHLFVAAALTGFQVHLRDRWNRSAFRLSGEEGRRAIDPLLSKNRRKSLKRAAAKLEEQGRLHFRIADTPDDIPGAAHRFLDLEQRGWKKQFGTAIACSPEHRNFFEKMVESLSREKKVLFAELCINEDVIASSCNLIEGSTLFAFKIGWIPELRAGSPGILAEIELSRYISEHRPDITMLNSCSQAGSYLEAIWPDQLAMGNVILTHSHRAVLFSGLEKSIRTAKRLLWPSTSSEKAIPETSNIP